MLARIRAYLQQRGPASLADIARHLGSEPAAVRPMLAVWIAKGRVSRLPAVSCPSVCRRCDSTELEVYAWGTDARGAAAPPACRKT